MSIDGYRFLIKFINVYVISITLSITIHKLIITDYRNLSDSKTCLSRVIKLLVYFIKIYRIFVYRILQNSSISYSIYVTVILFWKIYINGYHI